MDSLINNPDNSTHGQQSSTNIVSLESLPTEMSQSADIVAHSEVSNGLNDNDEKKSLDKTEENGEVEKETELPSSSIEITTQDQDLSQLGEEK